MIRWTIQLEPLPNFRAPDGGAWPPYDRLALALKRLLRTFGLRCVFIKAETAENDGNAPGRVEPRPGRLLAANRV